MTGKLVHFVPLDLKAIAERINRYGLESLSIEESLRAMFAAKREVPDTPATRAVQ